MSSASLPPRRIGRYALHGEIAAGGMATVHFGRLLGPVGFSRVVAIKRLHAAYARDPEFVSMFLDEARLAARIRHPNVVPTLDVVATGGELFLVMDYVQGESLARLMREFHARKERLPLRVVASILSGALQGLHAAHEARDERGMHLGIVHRDVSPQNILVGVDGLARMLDFGIAKAVVRLGTTRDGQIKGKFSYMAPEQMRSDAVTRQADIYAAGVLLWELLVGDKLFTGDTEAIVLARVLNGDVPPPSSRVPGLPPEYDAVTAKGLARDPAQRFATAREMALALERCEGPASPAEVAEWLERAASAVLDERAQRVAEIEAETRPIPADATEAVLKGTAGSNPPPEGDAGSDPPTPANTITRPQMPASSSVVEGSSPPTVDPDATQSANVPSIWMASGGQSSPGRSRRSLVTLTIAIGAAGLSFAASRVVFAPPSGPVANAGPPAHAESAPRVATVGPLPETTTATTSGPLLGAEPNVAPNAEPLAHAKPDAATSATLSRARSPGVVTSPGPRARAKPSPFDPLGGRE